MFLVAFSISCFSQTFITFSDSWEQLQNDNYFIVTAYYSPLPNQDDYITEDYAGDIRLNGSWNHGASGKEVFAWMLAAPKKYPFGTKIYLEWLWIGSVEDRGWSIIEASDWGPSHDRIDVWMGYGDEGRQRAILWGARKISWYVISDSSTGTTIKFWDTISINFSSGSIWPDSNPEDIKKLQKFLVSLKMYSGLIDGNHDSIRDIIIDYQLKKGIISSRDDEEAGYFWAKTVAQIKRDYPTMSFSTKKTNTSTQKVSSNTNNTGTTITNNPLIKVSVTRFWSNQTNYVKAASKDIDTNSDSSDIKQLQTLLTHIWIYSWGIDGNYTSVKQVLINYQLKRKIITSKSDIGAGNFGPKTRETLKKEYANFLSTTDKQTLNSEISFVSIPEINIWPDSKSDTIKQLQKYLKSINLYSWSIDGTYATIKDILVNYQLKKGIIQSKDDEAAGYWGPKTREKLRTEMKEIAEK